MIVGKIKFDAHRIVLSSAIPYFQTMFSKDFLERNERVVELKGKVVEESDSVRVSIVILRIYYVLSQFEPKFLFSKKN